MKLLTTILLLISTTSLYSQTSCDSLYIYEEVDGLLVIEYEHGDLIDNWKVGTTLSNYTGDGYIYWDGSQYLNQTGNGIIEYKIKINTPGKYRFNHRMATGMGNNTSDHNDIWLKIDAETFYGEQNGGHKVTPKPDCQTNAYADCPNGSTEKGYFKIFGHSMTFKWNASTSDSDSHLIYAIFNQTGVYTITINARSSWCLLDRLEMHKVDDVTDATAQNTANPQSSCINAEPTPEPPVNGVNEGLNANIKVYPNPTNGIINIESIEKINAISVINSQGQIVLNNISNNTKQIDITGLPKGMYCLLLQSNSGLHMEKVLLK